MEPLADAGIDPAPPALVVCGTLNRVNFRAAEQAFERMNLPALVIGLSVASGVPAQPIGAAMALHGAQNRARGAHTSNAEFACGFEGGIYEFEGRWFEAAWMVVRRGEEEAWACTASYPIPAGLASRMLDGLDLDEAMEEAVGIESIGRHGGFSGFVTLGHVDRLHAYTDAIVCALSQFQCTELWTGQTP